MNLPSRIEINGQDCGFMTREKALGYWRAAVLLKKSCRMWQVGEPGWVSLTDPIRQALAGSPLTKEAERAAKIIAVEDADTSLLDAFPFVVRADYGDETSDPCVMVDNLAITPDIFSPFGRGAVRWVVQSVDVDDADPVFSSFSAALVEAAKCATVRRLLEA